MKPCQSDRETEIACRFIAQHTGSPCRKRVTVQIKGRAGGDIQIARLIAQHVIVHIAFQRDCAAVSELRLQLVPC